MVLSSPRIEKAVIFGLVVGGMGTRLLAGTFIDDRRYRPVVIPANTVSFSAGGPVSFFHDFVNAPISELFLYRYHAATGSWTMVPFQIDERTPGPDPLNPQIIRWFYLIPPAWGPITHDGLFNGLDELVFLIGDLGDRAPAPLDAWIPNPESRAFGRLEVVVRDSLDPTQEGYAYLYRSSTITDPVPTPYDVHYDVENDQITTRYYRVKHEAHGVIEDIAILEPGGNGQDIFDVLKLRFAGVLDFALPIDLVLTEENFYLYRDAIMVTPRPVVRLIRQVKQTVRIFNLILEDTPFWFQCMYFPYSATIETGASIYKEDLEKMFPEAEVTILLRYTRQSWDFNENAVGMRFYNPYNRAIPIDGVPDKIDKTVDVPVNAWSVVTGFPGTVLTHIRLAERNWDRIQLYYHDRREGGQADSAQFGRLDTGDRRSFGDHGIWLQNIGRDSLTMDLDLTAYFIPERHLDETGVARLRDMALRPLLFASNRQDATSRAPSEPPGRGKDFFLGPIYPNPFNGETRIAFSAPPGREISLSIHDLSGRCVRILFFGSSPEGIGSFFWDGTDEKGQSLPSGLYLCRLASGREAVTQKLILAR